MSEYKEWALAEGYVPQKLDNVYGFDEAKEYFNKYELVNPIHVIEYASFENLKKQNEIMREALDKVIKAADFYSSHADCKRDSWSCKCSYCKPNDHSINVSYAKKFLKDVEGVK